MNTHFQNIFPFSPKHLKGLLGVITSLRGTKQSYPKVFIRISKIASRGLAMTNGSPFRACPDFISGGLGQKAINA